MAYSAFPGNAVLFFDKHNVFIRYLFGCIISEFTLPAKLHTDDEGLLGPIGVVRVLEYPEFEPLGVPTAVELILKVATLGFFFLKR